MDVAKCRVCGLCPCLILAPMSLDQESSRGSQHEFAKAPTAQEAFVDPEPAGLLCCLHRKLHGLTGIGQQ